MTDTIIGIYAIKCVPTNRIYIGESIDVYKRWDEHIQDLKTGCHDNNKMQLDYNLYGMSAFTFDLIEHTPPQNGYPAYKAYNLIMEKTYIHIFGKSHNLYNIRDSLSDLFDDNEYNTVPANLTHSVINQVLTILSSNRIINHNNKPILKQCTPLRDLLAKYNIRVKANANLSLLIDIIPDQLIGTGFYIRNLSIYGEAINLILVNDCEVANNWIDSHANDINHYLLTNTYNVEKLYKLFKKNNIINMPFNKYLSILQSHDILKPYDEANKKYEPGEVCFKKWIMYSYSKSRIIFNPNGVKYIKSIFNTLNTVTSNSVHISPPQEVINNDPYQIRPLPDDDAIDDSSLDELDHVFDEVFN